METATAKQQRPNSNWEGMLKRWSLEKGTHHRAHSIECVYDHPALKPATLSDDETDHPPPQWRGKTREFFMTHEQPKYYDICDRVYDISGSFPMPDEDEELIKKKKEDKEYEDERNEELLDELDELHTYAEFTDVASLLHSDGCLFSFLRNVLSYKHAGIRAKAAEVITTMVQKYPTSQQLLIEGNCVQLLLNNFTSYPGETSRTKTLGAISSLIWNNKSGITALRKTLISRGKGYAALRKALISRSVCQREVVNLIEYLLRENNLYSQELNLAFSCDDAELVRVAALGGLRVLARKGEYLTTCCCCFYHRSKQSNLLIHTLKKRKEKKKQFKLHLHTVKKKKQFKLEKNEASSAATPTVQGN